MEQDYYIIYASKTELDIVQDWSWEKDYYNLASRESFSKQISAIKYAKELAEENNLTYIGYNLDEHGDRYTHKYLD